MLRQNTFYIYLFYSEWKRAARKILYLNSFWTKRSLQKRSQNLLNQTELEIRETEWFSIQYFRTIFICFWTVKREFDKLKYVRTNIAQIVLTFLIYIRNCSITKLWFRNEIATARAAFCNICFRFKIFQIILILGGDF